MSILTPWTPGTGTVNAAGTVAAPAALAPGAVTAAARTRGKGATVTGRVTQAGQARGGATVTIFGGAKKTGLKRLGRVKVGHGRHVHVQGEGRHVLQGERSRHVGGGGAALHRTRSRPDAPDPVRQPDGERVHRAEQGRPQEVVPVDAGGTSRFPQTPSRTAAQTRAPRLPPAPSTGPASRTGVRAGSTPPVAPILRTCPRPSGSARAASPTRASSNPGTRGESRRAKARLGYYAERFDTVEVDSPYYHLPDPAVTGRWAQRTPPEFVFHVKAHAIDDVARRPADQRARFAEFRASLEPLELSGKLRGILLQYHPRFVKSDAAKAELRASASAHSSRWCRSSSSAIARGWSRQSEPTRSPFSNETGSPTSRSTRR